MLHDKVPGNHAAGRTRSRLSALRAAALGAAMASVTGLPAIASPQETVLYAFPDERLGIPAGGLVMDANGNLYGTAAGAATSCESKGCGTVFELTPPEPGATGWTERRLHLFRGDDGARPVGGLVMDANGALYGATVIGGGTACERGEGCGTVFRLTPPAAGESRRTETVLYRFKGGTDGVGPYGSLIMDANGALYGTTYGGGVGCSGGGCGTVFKLTPPASGESRWSETVLHRFEDAVDGGGPLGGLIMDASGALYGATEIGGDAACGGQGCGTVFKLTALASGESRWNKSVLHRFKGGADGANPSAGLIMDASGALYGTTDSGGVGCFGGGCGTVFKLTPPASGESRWTETVLHRFKGGAPGASPGGLIVDASGALYGPAGGGGGSVCFGNGCGLVFKLTPPQAITGTWTEKVLYRFQGGADGAYPGGLIMDASGALFGTTQEGGGTRCGGYGCGTVFELVP